MSATGLGIRTIWITLRAADYTAQAFNNVSKNTETLKNKEKDLEKQNKSLTDSTLAWFKAGLMMGTLSVSLAGAIWNLAASSREGAGDFARLHQQMFLTKQAFANTFYEVLKSTGILSAIQNILTTLQQNKALQYLTITTLAFGTVLTGLLATIFFVNAAWGISISGWTIGNIVIAITTVAVNGLKAAFTGLGGALGIVTAGVTVFLLLGQVIGSQKAAIVAACAAIAAAILAIFFAETLVVGGVNLAPAVGALAVGAGIAAGVMGMGSFPIGTRSLREDGPIYGHKGEVVYNPNTNMPTQIGNDLLGSTNKPSITNNYFNMPISNLNTKAEYSNIEDEMNKSLRRTVMVIE